MSYDLAIWDGPKPATNADASAEYERRMDAMEAAYDGGGAAVPPTASITAFIGAALDRFPDLDENSGPECPWSSPIADGAMGDLIYFHMTFSGAEFARDVLAEIAGTLGLVCFDPQIDQMLPDADAVPASTISAAAYAALAKRLRAEEKSTDPRRATHRAELESGEKFDDPSEDALFMFFEDVESGRIDYLIVEDLRDASGQTYGQSKRNDDGTYVVEYRAGGEDRHFATSVADMRAAHALIAGWTFDLPGWHESVVWEPLTF